jgi:hypothetical protein
MGSPYLHETAFDPTLTLPQAPGITHPQETTFSFCLGLVSLKITKKIGLSARLPDVRPEVDETFQESAT